jgi:hypothetical protein
MGLTDHRDIGVLVVARQMPVGRARARQGMVDRRADNRPTVKRQRSEVADQREDLVVDDTRRPDCT